MPKFCSKINGEFCFGAFSELLQGLEVKNKSNTMPTRVSQIFGIFGPTVF